MDPFQIPAKNNKAQYAHSKAATRIKTWARYQQKELIQYFNQQPVNSIAIFYKSLTNENHEEDYRNMLHRSNYIVHLNECINIEDIKKLDINITTWNLGNNDKFNMLWINDRKITLDSNRIRRKLYNELMTQHQTLGYKASREQFLIKPNEKSYLFRAGVSISHLQSNERPTSNSPRFDDPLPDEEQEESIRESSNIQHGEALRAEASLLQNQNDNLLNVRQSEIYADQEDEELKDN